MIYAMQPLTGGPVKIGFSADVGTRRARLESHYGKPLALLATMPGGREEEAEIHARFSHLRLGRTEQFRPAADLMAFLGRPLLVDANPEAVEVMKGKQLKGKPALIGKEVLRRARLAAMMMKEPFYDYLNRIVGEQAEIDIMREAKKLTGGSK